MSLALILGNPDTRLQIIVVQSSLEIVGDGPTFAQSWANHVNP